MCAVEKQPAVLMAASRNDDQQAVADGGNSMHMGIIWPDGVFCADDLPDDWPEVSQ
jgi:hypothetical protein